MAGNILPHLTQTDKRSAISFCPHCSKSLIILPGGSSSPGLGPGWRQSVQFQSIQGGDGVPSAVNLPGDWQKVTPVGRLNTGDVTTSLYDALVSFCLVSVGGVGVCLYAGWPWPWALIAGYGWSMWRYFGGVHLAKNLLEIVESLSAPQSEPEPEPVLEPEPLPIPLEVVQKNQAGIIQRMFRFSLPGKIDESLFTEWIRGVLRRDDLTQSRWVGPDSFVREDYVKLLALLLKSEIIERVGKAKNAPYGLTVEGRRSLRRYILIINDTHSHSLTQHEVKNGR